MFRPPASRSLPCLVYSSRDGGKQLPAFTNQLAAPIAFVQEIQLISVQSVNESADYAASRLLKTTAHRPGSRKKKIALEAAKQRPTQESPGNYGTSGRSSHAVPGESRQAGAR